MRSSSSSVSFNYALRFTLLCLLATGALLHARPPSVFSSNQSQITQSLAPEINTGALSTAREGHTATLLQNGKVLVAGGRNGSTIHNTAEIYDPATATWASAGTLTNARYGHSAVLLRNGLVLVIGGQGNNGFLNSAEIYDPSNNNWQSALLSQMNAARFHTTATLLTNGRVLVAGGMNSSGYLRSAELYDPTSRNWTRLDPGNNPAGNLTDARAEHSATLLTDGRVLVAGGFNGTAALRTAELFEPNTNRWRRVGDLATPRRQHTATLLPDSTVLVAGGLNGATALNSSETYNSATIAWTASGNLASGRSAHTATLLPNGRLLVAGGQNAAGSPLNAAEVYNYLTRLWSGAPLPSPNTLFFNLTDARSNHTATMLPSGRVLLVGGLGNDTTALNSAELYEYASGSWALTKNVSTNATTQLATARAGHTATLLPTGKVLVAGGVGSNSPLIASNSAELYDPTTGTWSPTGSLNNARFNHTATLLPNGKVLVIGGQNDPGISTAELYDPVTGFWTNTPAPGVPRYLHTATLLPNGLVLVVGGIGFSGVRTASVQLFDPNGGVNGSWSNGPPLPAVRSNHSATLLPNGTVFVFGGFATNTTAFNNGAIFTPAGTSGSWASLSFTDTGSTAAPAFRHSHSATLLPTNKVLIAGGRGGTNAGNISIAIGTADIFNIATSTFERDRATVASRLDHTATLLPSGKVLLFGGTTISSSGSTCGNPSAIPPAQLFDPFVPAGTAVTQIANPLQARNAHAATLLPNGQVLVVGGQAAEVLPDCADTLLNQSELYDIGLGFQENWRPVISFLTGSQSLLTINGAQFQGISEASGDGAQSSTTNYPVAQLYSLGSGRLAFLPVSSVNGWSNNTFNYNALANFAPGPALLTIYANGIPSLSRVVNGNGSNFSFPNALPTGSISGRVILHNGEGLVANVALEPVQGSPAGCTTARTITTGPTGDFAFRDLVIRPTPPTISCGPNLSFNCASPNGCTVPYQTPTASPAGTAVSCTPASGAVFPIGTTTVNCTTTNSGGSASCSFAITLVAPTTLTITCPPNPAPVTANPGTIPTAPVFFAAPVANPAQGTTTSCTHTSGQAFPVGTTRVTCTATNQSLNQQASCGFNVTVLAPGPGFAIKSQVTTPPTANYPIATPIVSASPTSQVSELTKASAPEQGQTFCRYRITPTATVGNRPLNFFPTAAIFNMVDNTVSFAEPTERATNALSEPTQTGEQNCTNCVNNIFVSNGPTYVLSGRVQKQDGQGVADVNLEFSVPYAILDDRLTCYQNGAPIKCTTSGAKTINGDTCTRASTNPLDPAAEFHCVCTQENNGVCEKTVLARYPTPPLPAAEPNLALRWSPFDWQRPLFQINPDGTFTVANVPHGANAIVTPQNRAGGTQYSFSYQPLVPPGLPPQSFIRIDRVEQTYANQTIIAQTACTPPSATITPAAAQVCANSTGNTASVPDAGAGATYNWTITNGTITSGQNTRNVTYTAGAAGSVMLNMTVSLGAGCSTSNSITLPIVPLSTANAGTDQTLCQSANGTTVFTVTGAVANGSPAWSIVNLTGTAAATISAPNAATTNVNVTGNGTVTLRLTVTSGNGCAPASDDVLLTVNALPNAPAITAPASVCANSTNNQASGPAGASSYMWTINNGTITSGATAQTVTYTAGATGNVTLTLLVTNAATCAASNTLNIPLATTPTVTTQPANQTVCENDSVTFTAAANNSSSVQWQISTDGGANFNNVPGANNATLNITASLAQNGARYRAVFANSCGPINTNAATLTVNPRVSISTQPASQAACVGASVTFNVVANGTAPLTYQWRKNGAPINGATNSSLSLTAVTSADAGSYDVTISSGCGTIMSNAALLTVNAFALAAQNAAFPATGGTSAVDLTATVGQCTWNAVSNDSWITITSVTSTSGTAPGSGTGNGRVNYSVATNAATTSRTGTLTIAGLTYTVTQSGSALAPRLDALSQNSAPAGSAGFTLTVTGANFTNTSVVRWQGSARATSFTSATQLTAQITAADLATAGAFMVDVFDPPPGGGASNALSFTVTQPNPVPTLASLNPNTATAGGAAFTLTVNGTNFVNGAVVRWNNADRNTSFVSATQLTAAIPASDIATSGTATVTVFNPAPGGGTSNSQSFTINQASPAPMFVAMSPSTAIVGGQGFTLTIIGSGFANNTIVRWNGSDRPTTFVNSTRLTAAIPASDIAQTGINQVTIFTPPPGGGTATALPFVVGAQATNASAASFALVRGAAEAIISVFGVELATTTVSATMLPLPTTLAGTTVKVRDSLGAERNAPLFFVSPNQINYLVPQGTALGAATAIITSGNNKISVASLDVQIVAPGLFTANATGQGAPAGLLLRISNGQQTFEPLSELQAGNTVPRPINFGPAGDQVFLVLFGTGMRGLTSLFSASASLGGVNLPVLFIGAQSEFVGVDQVNLGPLPRSLAGRGNVNLVLTVEGQTANMVQLNIQ